MPAGLRRRRLRLNDRPASRILASGSTTASAGPISPTVSLPAIPAGRYLYFEAPTLRP